jgi:CspA family cold shock protein
MNLNLQITISIIIALAAATLLTLQQTGGLFDLETLIAFLVATIATTLATRSGGPRDEHHDDDFDEDDFDDDEEQSSSASAPARKVEGKRENGKVKWFNVSKGFGFIVKDDGEEVFVHFRSIRGTGRRSLKDDQRVNFVVTQGDKGPQAEDVAPE